MHPAPEAIVGRSAAQTGPQAATGASARGGQAGRHVSMHLRAARRGFSIIDKISIKIKTRSRPQEMPICLHVRVLLRDIS